MSVNEDTLVVTASRPVIIFTDLREVIAVNSNVLVKDDLRRLDALSLSINLVNSRLYSLPISQDSKTAQALYEFRISGDAASVIDLNGSFDIGHLYLANVGQFNCSSDAGFRETDFSFRT